MLALQKLTGSSLLNSQQLVDLTKPNQTAPGSSFDVFDVWRKQFGLELRDELVVVVV